MKQKEKRKRGTQLLSVCVMAVRPRAYSTTDLKEEPGLMQRVKQSSSVATEQQSYIKQKKKRQRYASSQELHVVHATMIDQ